MKNKHGRGGPIKWWLARPKSTLLIFGLAMTLAPRAFLLVRQLVGQIDARTGQVPAILMLVLGLEPSVSVRIAIHALFVISVLVGLGLLIAAAGLALRDRVDK